MFDRMCKELDIAEISTPTLVSYTGSAYSVYTCISLQIQTSWFAPARVSYLSSITNNTVHTSRMNRLHGTVRGRMGCIYITLLGYFSREGSKDSKLYSSMDPISL